MNMSIKYPPVFAGVKRVIYLVIICIVIFFFFFFFFFFVCVCVCMIKGLLFLRFIYHIDLFDLFLVTIIS